MATIKKVFKSIWHFFKFLFIPKKNIIKLAVVGSNSHGKSYLLFDIIHAFERLGYIIDKWPNIPYSSWHGYYNSVSLSNGGLRGTDRYACRQVNHYGAKLTKTGESPIYIEFVNIPGEVFKGKINHYKDEKPKEATEKDEKDKKDVDNISVFYALKAAIESTPKGIFTVTTWTSHERAKKYVVEPVEAVRKANGINTPFNRSPQNVTLNPDSVYNNSYEEWDQMYARLQKKQFTPDVKSTKPISGKELIKNFFKYEPDSVRNSIHDAWGSINTGIVGIDADGFLNDDHDKNFYFLMYCLSATDMIICDKLFSQSTSGPSEKEKLGAEGYVEMTGKLNEFLDSKYHGGHSPNIYLAFRGADMMINEEAIQTLNKKLCNKECNNIANTIYSIFLDQLLTKIANETHPYLAFKKDDSKKDDSKKDDSKKDDSKKDDSKKKKMAWLGLSDKTIKLDECGDLLCLDNLKPISGMPFKEHIYSRIGDDTSGFKQLLNSVHTNKQIDELSSQKTLPITPHVFFTATPIDAEYRIYKADVNTKNRSFIRYFPEVNRLIALNTIGQYLSFGTTQLCWDILCQHIDSCEQQPTSGSLLKNIFIRQQD